MEHFYEALASAKDQPGATFRALEKYVDAIIGIRLFTLMTFNKKEGVSRRIYTNMPDAYPVKGTKPVHDNAWTKLVLDDRKTFCANDIAAIAEVFPDHELIASLGCESCINIPVAMGGEVLGTLNCLHEAGHFTPARLAASETLKLPGAIAFVMYDRSL